MRSTDDISVFDDNRW